MREYRSYLITAAAALFIGLLFRFAASGYSFLGYMCFLVAAAAIYFGFVRMLGKRREKAARILNKIAVYAIILFSFALAVTLAMLISDGEDTDNTGADYAVVLGAGVNGRVPSASLHARLEAALKYAEANPDTILILSGGQGRGEAISEAQCMYDWLYERGVSPDRMIIEDKAESTRENLELSRKIILEREPDFAGTLCVITEGYHATRGKLYAHRAGFERVTSAAGYTGLPVLTANYYIREAFAIWYYLAFER